MVGYHEKSRSINAWDKRQQLLFLFGCQISLIYSLEFFLSYDGAALDEKLAGLKVVVHHPSQNRGPLARVIAIIVMVDIDFGI